MNKQILWNFLSQESFWLVNKKLAQEIGLVPAVVLSELISKEKYHSNQLVEGKWFYHSAEKIEEVLNIGRDSRRSTIRKLIKLGLIEQKTFGMPARNYFAICHEKILEIVTHERQESVSQDRREPTSPEGWEPTSQERREPTPHINKNKEIKINNKKEYIDPIPKIQETSFFGEDQSIKFVQSLKSTLKTYKPKFQRIESQSVRLLIAEGIQLDEITKTMQKFESLRAKDDFLAKIPFSIQTLVGKNNDFRMYNYILDMPENTTGLTETSKNYVSNGKIAITSSYGVYGGLKPIPEPDPNDY